MLSLQSILKDAYDIEAAETLGESSQNTAARIFVPPNRGYNSRMEHYTIKKQLRYSYRGKGTIGVVKKNML